MGRDSGRATSTLPAPHVADPLTLLALRVNGEVISPDHGCTTRSPRHWPP